MGSEEPAIGRLVEFRFNIFLLFGVMPSLTTSLYP
jgi:hypothetical protein